MKRVIHFQRTRYWFFALSAALIATGVLFYVFRGGLNLGVDFKAGIALQFQVAPASFALQYSGPGKAEITIPAGEQALTAPGDVILTVTAPDGARQAFPFRYADYATVQALADAVGQVPGVTVELKGSGSASPSRLVPLTRPADVTGKPFTINIMPDAGSSMQAAMADVRSLLAPLGQFDLQAVGRPANQEYIVRMEAKEGEADFQSRMESSVVGLLAERYGADQVILKRTDFVGPRLAGLLGRQSIWLIVVALVLIQVYMAFRFKIVYAVAAVAALVHDALIMLAFMAVFRVEVDAGTIAAILTIIGYSINDTIVIFDRVRENQPLMRGASLETLLDTSVTQTLSRTFITSGATLLTVVALFVLTSGSMKNFALAMIVGIFEGTYSTVFIASPIVLEWENARERRRKRRELEKYGVGGAPQAREARQAVEAEAQAEPGEEAPALGTDGLPAQEAAMADEAQPVPAAQAASPDGQAAAQTASGATAPQAPVATSPDARRAWAGSRRHKKHRRGH